MGQIGVKYEMTSLANYLQLATKFEGMKAEDREHLPNAAEVAQALEIYRATKSYNPHRVAAALSLNVPKAPTWGRDSPFTVTQRSTGHLGLL